MPGADTPGLGLGSPFWGPFLWQGRRSWRVLRTPTPAEHAYGATLLVLGGYALFHAALVALMLAFLTARVARGFTSARRHAEFPVVALWVDYLAATAILILAVAHAPGLLA